MEDCPELGIPTIMAACDSSDFRSRELRMRRRSGQRCAHSPVDRHGSPTALRQVRHPALRRCRVGKIVAVERDQARASAGKLVEQRMRPLRAIRASTTSTTMSIERKYSRIRRMPLAMCRDTIEPAAPTSNSQFPHVLRSSQSAPMMLGGQRPATARPIKRSSFTGPNARESSLLARLSPKT